MDLNEDELPYRAWDRAQEAIRGKWLAERWPKTICPCGWPAPFRGDDVELHREYHGAWAVTEVAWRSRPRSAPDEVAP